MTIAVMDRRLLLFSRPGWVLPGASIDINFAGGVIFGGTLSSSLSITRAGANATNLLPTSASGAAYTTFAANTLRIDSNGLLIEESRVNQLLNSAAPATQTTASLGTGSYTLWVNGSGSALASAGTATISGASSASNGSPNTFSVTVAGTVTITVTGSLNAFQLELGTNGTSLVITTGAVATRDADSIMPAGTLLSVLSGSAASVVIQTSGAIRSGSTVALLQRSSSVPNDAVLSPNTATTVRSLVGGLGTAQATFGSGTVATAFKAANSFNAVSGISNVVNAGTVATSASTFSAANAGETFIGSKDGSTAATFIDGYIARLTAFNLKISDSSLKAFTQ